MKVVVIAPPDWLNEWKKIPLAGIKESDLFYSVQEGIQPVPPDITAVLYLFAEQDAATLNWLKQLPAPVCIINSVLATTQETGPELVRINAWPGFLAQATAEMACAEHCDRQQVESVMQLLGRKTEWVADCCGMLTPRIIASIINEAYFAMNEQVSTAAEIDIAMKMGTNYPHGPVEWGKMIGLRRIYNLLQNLAVHQKRYTPSSLLKNEALA